MILNLKKTIPNAITLSNLFLGFVSIVLIALSINSSNQYIVTSCYLILIAAFLDVLDGKVARKLNISSNFGKEIDSLADLISFCLVPSFLLFYWYNELNVLELAPLIIMSSCPLIFGAIRLAKYNAMRNMRESIQYIGMPTPANAIFICSLILYANYFPIRLIQPIENIFFQSIYLFLEIVMSNELIVLFLSLFSSLLLLSRVNYEKFPLISFKIDRRNTIDLIKLILFLIILFSSVFLRCHDIVLLFFMLIYIYGNLVKYFYRKLKNT
tara:strand:- start:455 stop:1261 length:807 start_codon:yes stop_codon:yes gene_type:complete